MPTKTDNPPDLGLLQEVKATARKTDRLTAKADEAREERDAAIAAAARSGGFSQAAIAEAAGVSRQMVAQVRDKHPT